MRKKVVNKISETLIKNIGGKKQSKEWKKIWPKTWSEN